MFERLIGEMVRDRAHGAGWLARRALAIMKMASMESRAKTPAEFLSELALIGNRLLEARPSMAPLANLVALCYFEACSLARGGRSVAELRELVAATANELERGAERASLAAAEKGASLIADDDVVVTGSYSSVVCQLFVLARDRSRKFRVLVAESRFGDESFGERLRFELARRGLTVSLFPDLELEDNVKKAQKVIVGADAVLRDGSVVNGYPSLRLARAASDAGIPFYSVCELSKFSGRPGVPLEPGFDLVPAELVTAVITERGRCPVRMIEKHCRSAERNLKLLEMAVRPGSGTVPSDRGHRRRHRLSQPAVASPP